MKKEKTELVKFSRWPDSVATDSEKATKEFGLKVGHAIQYEWFRRDSNEGDSGYCNFYNQKQMYHELRLYARGQQPISKYKDRFKVNGDNSYLNLDWSPVPIGAKFTDLVVNGMNERLFSPKAFAEDITSSERRDSYQTAIEKDMIASDLLKQTMTQFGIDAYNVPPGEIPANEQELQLHMQLKYKPSIEIAAETAISTVFEMNDYQDVRYQLNHDLVTIDKCVAKHEYIDGDGIVIKYCDPGNVVHNFTEDPFHKDLFYIGEVKQVNILELKKINPSLTDEDIKDVSRLNGQWNTEYTSRRPYDDSWFQKDVVNLLYFNWKTDKKFVHKVKNLEFGGEKAILRDETFSPAPEQEDLFDRVEKKLDVWYEGVLILGTDKLLKWELLESMVRPESAFQKVYPNYVIVSPKNQVGSFGSVDSIVKRMIPFIDQIQITHLKIQQVMQRVLPDGIFIDVDGFAELDLGDGGVYNVNKAFELYLTTGSFMGRSYTAEGDYNQAKMPFKEINHSSGAEKLKSLVDMYNHYLNMLREVTGINMARDASTPDPKSLVGIQKMAALNSNTATRHILDASLFVTRKLAECISLRISDVLKYSDDREEFANQIGRYNVSILEEIKDLPLYSFGIFIEVSPDAEEKSELDRDVQVALQEKTIDLEDAIEVRQVKNIKMALELLKLKKRKKQERDDQQEQMKMKMQAEVNAQSANAAADAEIKKQTAILNAKKELEITKSKGEKGVLSHEADLKKGLMKEEFDYNMQLAEVNGRNLAAREREREDRKDNRVDLQSSNQSRLIRQKETLATPTTFESEEDSLDGLRM